MFQKLWTAAVGMSVNERICVISHNDHSVYEVIVLFISQFKKQDRGCENESNRISNNYRRVTIKNPINSP